MTNYWCYECYFEKKKPKGIFKNLYFIIWKSVGISPSGVVEYVNYKLKHDTK